MQVWLDIALFSFYFGICSSECFSEWDRKMSGGNCASKWNSVLLLQPEWYLTQVLSWVRDHWDFLDRNIQPLLDEAGRRDVCAKVGFTLISLDLLVGFFCMPWNDTYFDKNWWLFLVTTYFFFLSQCFIYPNRDVCAKLGFSLISLDLLVFFLYAMEWYPFWYELMIVFFIVFF